MIELKSLEFDPTGWVNANWVNDNISIFYQSFHPTQIDLLREKALEFGTSLEVYEEELNNWVNSYIPPENNSLDPEELQKIVVTAVQNRLDDFARTRNYDNILSAATYATSSVEKFRIEGQYAVDIRDRTWAKLYEILDEILNNQRPMPNGIEDIENELPVLEWP